MATPREIILKVDAEMRSAGIGVTFEDGWETRGRPGAFTPRGVVCHHTATSAKAKGDYPSLALVRDGRGGDDPLPGPLAQFGLGRSGQVFVIAAGKANHAGPGGFGGLTGNNSVWGIEAENDGVSGVWPAVQLDAYARLCAALARHTGFGADLVIAHREWSTQGKIDPKGIEMVEFRARVAGLLKNIDEGRETTDMFIFDGPDGGIFRTDGVTRWPVRSMDTASVLMDVGRVRHLGKLTKAAFNDLKDGEAAATAIQDELGTLRTQIEGVAAKVASLN